MVLSWWETFKLNLSHIWAYATAWVLGMWGLIGVYWTTMMTDADHQGIYDMMPFGLGKAGPLIVFAITYIAAHGWPQPALEAKLEIAKEKAVDKALLGPV